jgi:hypothetical protein
VEEVEMAALKGTETNSVGSAGKAAHDREAIFLGACRKSSSANYQQLVEAAVEFKYLATIYNDKDAGSRYAEILEEQPQARRQGFLNAILQGVKEKMKSA